MPKLTISEYMARRGTTRLSIRGPSGTRYIFEAGQPTEVHEQDATMLLGLRNGDSALLTYWTERIEHTRGLPLHVIRHPGLGDKVFALAALWAYKQQNPDVPIYFDTHIEMRRWVERVPFVKFGKPPGRAQVVDFDNIPANAGDRCRLFGRMLGVEVHDIRFPVRTQPFWEAVPRPYVVFAPWCGPWKLRSLPYDTIQAVLQQFQDYRLAIVCKEPCPFPTDHIDLTGSKQGTIDNLWDILADAAAVISVDTGITWMAAALGKPTLAFFGHVPPQDRVATCRTVFVVEPHTNCPMFPCGDHGAPPAPCGATEEPACMRVYTPEVVLLKMREFLALVL